MLLQMPLQMPLLFILSSREKDRLQQIYNLQVKDLLPLLSPSQLALHPEWFYGKHQGKHKRPFSSSKLSSISRRGRFDSAFRIAADFYPLPRWRPVRSRRNSAQNSIVDLRQLSENFREFERKNRRKSVTRFFNC